MPDSGGTESSRRSLPSWTSSREDLDNFDRKKPADDALDKEKNEEKVPNKGKRHDLAHSSKSHSDAIENKAKCSSYSKLLEGVVFVLSGFINPERGAIRSQALEMGAEYQVDWNDDCTLLVCAFPNTPKFRQVAAESGTIVSKEWIHQCYNERKLVDIDSCLLHVGKPWRRQSISSGASQDQKLSPSKKSKKQERASTAKPLIPVEKKPQKHGAARDWFLLSEVRKWATDDMQRTIAWLDSQDDKPDASEIRMIAVEGILTCLQDAIDSLKLGCRANNRAVEFCPSGG